METKILENKVLGFIRNSSDAYAKHLIGELLDELHHRDKEIRELKNEKRVVREVRVERETEYNFGPGGA